MVAWLTKANRLGLSLPGINGISKRAPCLQAQHKVVFHTKGLSSVSSNKEARLGIIYFGHIFGTWAGGETRR